jgi:hypothetical protein
MVVATTRGRWSGVFHGIISFVDAHFPLFLCCFFLVLMSSLFLQFSLPPLSSVQSDKKAGLFGQCSLLSNVQGG